MTLFVRFGNPMISSVPSSDGSLYIKNVRSFGYNTNKQLIMRLEDGWSTVTLNNVRYFDNCIN